MFQENQQYTYFTTESVESHEEKEKVKQATTEPTENILLSKFTLEEINPNKGIYYFYLNIYIAYFTNRRK